MANHPPTCACGTTGTRDETHDAYYCPSCRTWLEWPCGDAECEFCESRPATAPTDTKEPS